MSADIYIAGCGAVSPAGWGAVTLLEACRSGDELPTSDLARPGWERPFHVRRAPPLTLRPAFLKHPRMRRVSPISRFAAFAALEALGEDKEAVLHGDLRLGIVVSVMSGCVAYSKRFYHEVWTEPATASPLVFPETVFNAPASHLAALLETPDLSYTLVGDDGAFLKGVGLAARWLLEDSVDGCVVVGAEEMDWLTPDSFRLFSKEAIMSEGAGALYLRRAPTEGRNAMLGCVTTPRSYSRRQGREPAARRMRRELPPPQRGHLLLNGIYGSSRRDRIEGAIWQDWHGACWLPKRVLGEGLSASAAWQCVLAAQALKEGAFSGATVSVIGLNQQAIGAHFRLES